MSGEHPAADQPPVILRRQGHAGHIVLNRPRAINALTHEMVRLIREALDAWAVDDAVRVVVLSGAGERGLCAGADVVALWHDAKARGREAAAFWAEEYELNALIARYPKPYVAIMDGIVLGGGIGLSAHASHRVVTELSSIGMPEVGIGFIPDVGGTWLLAHAPGEVGVHLALTTGRMDAGEAIACGFADHYVPRAHLAALFDDLAERGADEALASHAQASPDAPVLEHLAWLDAAYAGDDVAAIVERLRTVGTEHSVQAAEAIESKSPTAVAVTLRALREAPALGSLERALEVEYRLALRCHAMPDYVEGVRAQVVDKDRDPQWSPATLAEVGERDVDAFFAPLTDAEGGELRLS